VVEYGYLEDSSPDILLPSPANNDRNMSRFYDYMSIPQTELNDKATIAYAAAIVGGKLNASGQFSWVSCIRSWSVDAWVSRGILGALDKALHRS
jgi:hypothetical protein